MLFVDDSEVDRVLNHEANISHKLMHDSGRPNGAKEIPLEQKAMIGIFSKLEGPSLASDLFGVSVSQASNFARGESVHGKGNPELKALVDGKLQDINSLTADLLMRTLQGVDLDKVNEEKPITQSIIAKNFAGIIEKTAPKGLEGANVHFHVYAPQPVANESFQTIEIEAVEK